MFSYPTLIPIVNRLGTTKEFISLTWLWAARLQPAVDGCLTHRVGTVELMRKLVTKPAAVGER